MEFKVRGYSSTFEELKTMYPTFYQNVFEMMEILKANGGLLDEVINAMNRTYSNAFVDTMDDESVSKLEEFLNIETEGDESLSQRKGRLKAHFTGYGKVSASYIKRLIKDYVEDAETEITFLPVEEHGDNKLTITMTRTILDYAFMGYIIWVYEMLKLKIPAHLDWDFIARCLKEDEESIYVGMAVKTTTFVIQGEIPHEDPTEELNILFDEEDVLLGDELANVLVDGE